MYSPLKKPATQHHPETRTAAFQHLIGQGNAYGVPHWLCFLVAPPF